MFSEQLVINDDINTNKGFNKKRLVIYALFPSIILLIVIIIIIILLSKKSNKLEIEEPYINNVDNYLIADFKLNQTNSIINTGLSNTSTILNYKKENGYFSGGRIKLNSSYNNCTIIAIVNYNKTTKVRLFAGDFAYYGGAIDFQDPKAYFLASLAIS